MCLTQTKTKDYWCVTAIYSDNKSLSSGLIHPNSIRLFYVSDSYFNCMKMVFSRLPKNLGGDIPFFNKYVTVQKVSFHTIMKLLDHEAEITAGNYDDEYGSAFSVMFKDRILSIWLTLINRSKDLDFRIPSAGVSYSEVRKCLR